MEFRDRNTSGNAARARIRAESPPAPQRAARRRVRRRLPAATRFQRPADSENAPLLLALRGTVALTAFGLLLMRAWQGAVTAPVFAVGLLGTALALLALRIPVAWTRERPLTFLAPVIFALLLACGPEAAAMSALTACFLDSRFARVAGRTRAYARYQGAQMAVSAFFAGAAWQWARVRFGAGTAGGGDSAQAILGAAAISAAAFTAANALLTAGTRVGRLRALRRSPNAKARLGGLALAYALGMLPVILLAPLGEAFGVLVALPVTFALILSAQVARLTLEVGSLRGQSQTAEAMGRASIAEPGTDVDPAILLQRFLTLAQALVASERAIVWTMDQESGLLTPTAALPDMGIYAGETATFGEGLIGQAAARIRPRLVADAARDPRRGLREPASGAWLLYPLIVHARLLGVAQWIRPLNKPFTQEDIARLAALVPQAAIALENVRIREAMLNLAATDGLTGLWNHRKMHDLLGLEMRRSARYHRALSVLMMDVDSFKTFNDTYGHPQGDQLLRNIAAILRANVRTVDHVGRYGGEEFLVILPETTKDDACRLAERIRSAVEEKAFVIIEERVIRRTISVGVASYPEDALNPGEIVQRADEALYRAKRAGKNRVLWA